MFSTDLLKTANRGLILAVLAEEPLYGYQIIKSLREKSEDFFQFGEGTLYPMLHLMEKEKLLTSEWRKEGNFPERKYYALTGQGKKMLKKFAAEWKVYAKAANHLYAEI